MPCPGPVYNHHPSMKNPPPPRTAQIEALEPRLAPAGIVTVTVSGGVLTLTGDNLDNNIKISSPAANIWKFEDLNAAEQGNIPTLFRIAGQPASSDSATLQLPTYAGLKVVLNGGNDKLDVINLYTNGPLTLLGGDGNDDIFLSGTYNGAINVDSGNGDDDVGLLGGFFNNTVTVKTGVGNDTAFFGSGNYARGITTDLGAGTNSFRMITDSSLNVFGHVNVTAAGGTGNQQSYYMGIKSGAVTGNVSFKTTAGSSGFFLGRDTADNVTINGTLTAQGAAGADVMLFAGKVSVGGGVIANFGAGENLIANGIDLDNNDANLLTMLSIGSLTYTGGANKDTLFLECPQVIIGGNVTLNMGAGENALTLISSTGALVGGALTYNGGAGNDRLDISGADLTVGGKLVFKGAGSADADRVFITPTYAALHSVELTGGGLGKDIFYIGAPDETGSTIISILGDLITNTGAGLSDVRITDAMVHGKITHTSAVALAQGAEDYFIIEDSYIQGAVAINAGGSAHGAVFINDSVCVANVTIATGAGDDLVAFDTIATNNLRASAFYGAVSISLGAGNDDWYAGSNPAVVLVGNQFKSTVKVDGGTGNNTSHYSYNNNGSNTFDVTPVFAGTMAHE